MRLQLKFIQVELTKHLQKQMVSERLLKKNCHKILTILEVNFRIFIDDFPNLQLFEEL